MMPILHNTVLAAHTVLCAILFWSAFCRIVKTNERETYLVIRVSFSVAGMAALVMMIAPFGHLLWPWFPKYRVHPAVLLMLASFVSVQVSTARHWRHGTPKSFTKEST